jgi:hypothetical protein
MQADTIATSIAGLSVSGVTIADLDGIPEQAHGRDCPLLYPKPDGFMSNLRVERDSFGPASDARKTVRYTLSYAYLHAPVSEGRGLFDVYQAMVQNTLAILDAIIADDALNGAVDITPGEVTRFGLVNDPAGSWFHGCVIALNVTEQIN